MIKDIIKEQMEYLNINQSDLVLKTGIDQKGLSDILNGKRPLTIDLSNKLGKAFGIDGNMLFNYQEKTKRTNEMKKDKDLLEIADFIDTLDEFKLMAKTSQLKTVSDFIRASSFSIFRNYVNSKVIGKMSYKDKNKAYFWIALMENKYGKKRSDKAFVKSNGNKVIDSVIKTMLGNAEINIKLNKTKAILYDAGIVLENGPFIKDSTIYGVSMSKNKQRYIFMSDMNKRECRYIFALVHELVHVYGRNGLTENEVDDIAAKKIKKMMVKENIVNKDMNVLFNAYESGDWDSIRTDAKARIEFGRVEDLFKQA